MQLSKNQRFVEEYKSWSEKISKISDDAAKNECLQLLKELNAHVRDIDKYHTEFTGMTKLPGQLHDVRENLITVRKKLDSKIKACEQANLIR